MLDVAPVWRGGTASSALRASLSLAAAVERLGYRRHWAAEHHNTPCLAATAPAVMAGQLANATSTLRIGSGGVLLPNHAPLVVAEQFGMLSAFHPGRIDLGVGRAPGGDARTAQALRRAGNPGDEEFAEQLAALAGYFTPRRDGAIDAGAAGEQRPPIWLLGSSPASARTAARLGLRYAYAHQINPAASEEALHAYRDGFQPSEDLAEPYALVCATAIVAESDAAADRLARPYLLSRIWMRAGTRFDAFPDQAAADAYSFSAQEHDHVRNFADRQLVGGRDTVRHKASELIAGTGADELMALTLMPGHDDRVNSYRLLAEAVRD
ncbi:LLM class flavin-dependent oxidoreductase [Kutzneria sp. CA-103260]|uniref:LLM class flavin-dependent oxidoreductase n=1 Tax=Kutzneria sp. CA-103260 TaxID=2802641 RepID=UPI001BEF9121|nr:LLM class flavin-dependent oxidoreductase [Kutzneria sp. CA-103260]QUQ68485.1 FMN-linked alkanal monooxygenase [Kutzneria sp. CA-103260]